MPVVAMGNDGRWCADAVLAAAWTSLLCVLVLASPLARAEQQPVQAVFTGADFESARAQQRSSDPHVSITGYMQEALLLKFSGRAREGAALLQGRLPMRLDAGMQAEYYHQLATISYDFDRDGSLRWFERAVELAPTAALKDHFQALRDSRQGRPVDPARLKSVTLVE